VSWPVFDEVTAVKVKGAASRVFGTGDLMEATRREPVATARQVAMALTPGPSKKVARFYGKKCHTTVLWARSKVESWVELYPLTFALQVATIKKEAGL
jgi:chromosomal replication initiation ATPase DnaA